MGIKDTLQDKLQDKKVRLAIIAVVLALIIIGIAYTLLVLPGNFKREGDSYMVQGMYEEAIQAYDKALFFHPNDGTIISHKGDALLGLGAYDRALASYEHAERSGEPVDWRAISQMFENAGRIDLASQAQYYFAQANRTSIFAWYKLAELQSQLREYDKAAASYERVAQLSPYSATLWLRKAETLVKLGYYQDAIMAYERAISVEPKLIIAYLRKADMQEAQGNLHGALATVNSALAIYPDSVQGWMQRYNILLQLNRYPEAVHAQRTAKGIQERYVPGKKIEYQDFSSEMRENTVYQRSLAREINALSLNGVNTGTLPKFLLMSAYLSNLRGTHAEAMRLSKQALALDPPAGIATALWTNLGEAYAGYEEYENAEEAFRQAIEKDVENQAAFAGLAYVSYRMGRYQEAIQAADQALVLDVGDADSWLIRGRALADSGDVDEAYISLLRADALRPEHVETLAKIAVILYERGEIERVLTIADHIISLSSDDADAWFYRAWTLLRLEEYRAANEAFNRAIQLAPYNAYGWLGRGQLYEALGMTTDALQTYGQALSLLPEDPVIQEAYFRADASRFSAKESDQDIFSAEANDQDIT
ncbi:MAG: tetratricopeptide repeat protein [Euryarchaeota archaeon]|nr:tetratricopeptide repeat protein [Euryarchaeota archaeon]